MQVTSTDVKNNFGKYLKACKTENVIITKNGKRQALLLFYPGGAEMGRVGEPSITYGTHPQKEERVTYRQFLEMTEKSDHRYELIDGKVYLLASPSFIHQKVVGNLHIAFWEYFKEHEDCGPFLSPLDIELMHRPLALLRELTEDDINVVQPDLVVLCDYEKDIDASDKYKGTPTLAIEILSPSSRSKDQIKKLDLYMESGIDEGWIVDPSNHAVVVYVFRNHEIEENAMYMRGQTARSVRFPGLQVAVDALF